MVQKEYVGCGHVVHWLDGRLPPKCTLFERTSIPEMARKGFDRRALAESAFYKDSHRRKPQVDRYEYFMTIVDMFTGRDTRFPGGQAEYQGYLLNPFSERACRDTVGGALARAHMYHKTEKNFRALLLIADEMSASQTRRSVCDLTTATNFLVSSPEGFEDYASFDEHLGKLLCDTASLADSDRNGLYQHFLDAGLEIEYAIDERSMKWLYQA